jgi:hypothetical protein
VITYKLNRDGDYAMKYVDGVETGEFHNTQSNQAYLKWLAEGNVPTPADEDTQ